MDSDFLNAFIQTPIADIPEERLKRIQQWLIIVFKKMEYSLSKSLSQQNINLSRTQIQSITSDIWNGTFRVPVLEMIQEEEIASQLLNQKIRPMTVDDIFNELNKSDLTEN